MEGVLGWLEAEDTDALMSEAKRWSERVRGYLSDGECYAKSLRSRSTRMATALPGLIGARTLELMDAADWETLSRGVKIKRREVYRCAWDAWIQ